MVTQEQVTEVSGPSQPEVPVSSPSDRYVYRPPEDAAAEPTPGTEGEREATGPEEKPEEQQETPKTYTQAEYDEGVKAQEKHFQSVTDQKIRQAEEQARVTAEAQVNLQAGLKLMVETAEEDPDQFREWMKIPELAGAWASHVNAAGRGQREQIEAEVRAAVSTEGLQQGIHLSMQAFFKHPSVEGWKQEDYEKANLWPSNDVNDYPAWHSRTIAHMAKHEAKSGPVVEAEVRDRIAESNEGKRDQMPTTGPGRPRMTWNQLQKATPEQINALPSEEYAAIKAAG